jgi:hypothetical protein
MVGWILGVLFVIAGVIGATNALSAVDRVARIWPRPYRRGDAGLFASTSFLIRFVSLLLLAVGIALIWIEVAGTS